MFGLGDEKKTGKKEVFVYEIERELKTPEKFVEITGLITKRIQTIKGMLQGGVQKGDYECAGVIAAGYQALLKVIGRVVAKK